MHKVVRNTLFTASVLGLTSLGIGWNKDIATNRQPLSAQQVALASESQNDSSLPVALTVQEQVIQLGQLEHISIQTVASATLDIVTKRPDGSVDPAHTLRVTADRTGRYELSFAVTDYHYLGVFSVSVISSNGSTSNQAVGQFWVTISSDQTDQASPVQSSFLP